MVTVDLRLDFRDVEIRVLDPLAPFQDEGRADQFRGRGRGLEVGLDLRSQRRLRKVQRFIQHDERFRHLALVAGQDLSQQRVGQAKHVLGKINPVTETDGNTALDPGHRD